MTLRVYREVNSKDKCYTIMYDLSLFSKDEGLFAEMMSR